MSCVCRAFWPFLILGRLSGTLPITTVADPHPAGSCIFLVSSGWRLYSLIIHVTLAVHMIFTNTGRLLEGNISDTIASEWYMLTMGYLISNLEYTVTGLFGIVWSHRFASLLTRLAHLLGECPGLQVRVSWLSAIDVSLYLIMTGSTLMLAVDRIHAGKNGYGYLDSPMEVVFRGLTSAIPFSFLLEVILLGYLLISKFQQISELLKEILIAEEGSCLQYSFIKEYHKRPRRLFQVNPAVLMNRKGVSEELNRAAKFYRELIECLQEFNSCINPQLLVAFSSGLYMTITYLYRYLVAPEAATRSDSNERWFYIIALMMRLLKLLSLMFVGHNITEKGKQPLDVLKRTTFTRLPRELNLQVEGLICSLSSDHVYLTASGVFNVGLWLLAPISSHVITYLLVALQFPERNVNIYSRENSTYEGGF